MPNIDIFSIEPRTTLVHPDLDRMAATDLFNDFESLPRAGKAFFVLRSWPYTKSLSPEEQARLRDLLQWLREFFPSEPIEPRGFCSIDPVEAEKIGAQRVAARGLTLFPIAVGALGARCRAQGWTEDQFTEALEKSGVLKGLDEWSGEAVYLLRYGMRRTGCWPWDYL